MFCIVRRDVGGGPMNVVVALEKRGLDETCSPGMDVRNDAGVLNIGAGALSIRLNTAHRHPKKSARRVLLGPLAITRNLAILADQISSAGDPEGLGGLLPFLKGSTDAIGRDLGVSRAGAMALGPLSSLVRALVTGQAQSVGKAARGLIGLGPGLTPAADDLLAGLMIAFQHTANALEDDDDPFVRDSNLTISLMAEGRTTLLSKEFLLNAAQGLGSEHVEALVGAVLFGSAKEVERAALKEIAVGATSGTDTALGVYLGVGIGLDRHRRRRQ